MRRLLSVGRTLASRIQASALFRATFLPEQNYLIVLALVVGLLTGLGSALFIRLLQAVVHFAQGSLANSLTVFGPARLVLLPLVGAFVAGPLIERFAREARGHGVPEVMTALATQEGRIRPRVAVVKVLASVFTIGFGGVAGREGPMVQIGSGIGSTVGQLARLRATHLRTLVACGAAGGIAATFNAPIAGAIFAVEVLASSLATDFLLVLLTSLSSCLVTRHFLGNHPAFVAPAYELVGAGELALYFVLGVLAALTAWLFVHMLYAAEDLFAGWRFPEAWKPAVGALAVGIVLRFFPDVYGPGLSTIESAMWVRFAWPLLIGLFFAELVGNCATLGSGGSGGIFAPSLFMGAMLGGAFGTAAHALFPTWTAGSGAYAMVGAAAMFAAVAKAPTTSILILFEMTNDYRIILPLMTATAVSTVLSNRLMPFSIYTLKLHRRGIDYDRGRRPSGS
jgi:CIC family chloride channel protein